MKVYGNIDNVNTEFVKNNLSKKENKSGKKGGIGSEDSVVFSSQLNNLKDLEEKAAGLDGMNQAKVDGIKLQVENGTYKISSEDIADKIIEEHLIK